MGTLDEFIAVCRENADPEGFVRTRSYAQMHSGLPAGTTSRALRETTQYALALLRRGRSEDVEFASQILRRVLSFQDTDPSQKTCGIWPYFAEQPLTQMRKPDWNWADFIGIRLAQILAHHASQFEADLVSAMRTALGLAADAIRTRDIGPDYTNIAVMGGVVTSAAGELLGDDAMLDYGRRRLARVCDHAAYHGGFTEYNSPHYIPVTLDCAEIGLHILRDDSARRSCETIRQTAWRIIADHFHLATQQWAGPHARAYSDWLSRDVCAYVSEQTGTPITPHPNARELGILPAAIGNPLPCPRELCERFRGTLRNEYTIRQRFIRREPDDRSIYGTTWFAPDACLGTVSFGDTNAQRRNLIAYWRTPDDPAVMLRTRFMINGEDRGPVCVRIAQQARRALLSVNLFDRPGEEFENTTEMLFRFELVGAGATIRQDGAQLFSLSAGLRYAMILTPPGHFGKRPIVWDVWQGADNVHLSAILHRGEPRTIVFSKDGPLRLIAVVELLTMGVDRTDISMPSSSTSGGVRTDKWGSRSMQTPVAPEPFAPFPVLPY